MALCGENLNMEKLVPQSEIEITTEYYIKEEPDRDRISSTEDVNYRLSEQQTGAATFYNRDSFKTEEPDEIEADILQEEIEIKDEIDVEWENTDVNFDETPSNSSQSAKYTIDNHDKLKRNVDYEGPHFKRLKIEGQTNHSEEKPFTCDQCDYRCGRSANLKIHQMKHSGEKPFACDQCSYRCGRSANLKIHKMKHSGEKPFACDQCDYSSFRKSDVKQHQMIHSREKSLACNVCDYKTTHLSHLKRHEITHSGEKSFACDQCDYKAARGELLRRHQFWQHSVKHSGQKSVV